MTKDQNEIIVRYLGSAEISINHQVFQEASEQLESQRERFSALPAHSVDLDRVWRHRILASNSLRSGKQSEGWDAASQYLAKQVGDGNKPSLASVEQVNCLLSGKPPKLRDFPIFTANEEYVSPQFVPELWELLGDKLSDERTHPLFQSFYAYLAIVTIHPFANANGRTARLIADWLLLMDGWLPLTFPSPIASHVAQTIGGVRRDVTQSFKTFVAAVSHSYDLAGPTNGETT
ncbi:MAG: Fic family protein [Pseudobacteriovorax sp.]|nr:Fic family protein [Pseudobacteriovorax sp.]